MSKVPCVLCGAPTLMAGTRRCDRCWELERRIERDPHLAQKILDRVLTGDCIEVMNTRFMGHFMARDYVTIREQAGDGETLYTETSVGRTLLKSAPARVSRRDGQYRIAGAAWGGPVERVEVQVDGSEWREAQLSEGQGDPFTWSFWQIDWDEASPGEHEITSRAVDADGNVQPAPDDPLIAGKRTFWESNAQVIRTVRIPDAG